MSNSSLRLTEIFFSLQGESSFVGLPTVFIRLTGCPLRCGYCDTAYAFEGGKKWQLSEILDEIKQYSTKYVCVTGGEPLAQPNCLGLLDALVEQCYKVSLETSGALDITGVNSEVARIMDLKTPSSGEQLRNLWQNINVLTRKDQVKFVIGTQQDFDWSVSKVLEYNLSERVNEILFSPVHGQYDLAEFADKVIDTNLPIRMQMQLHKYIWNDAQGR